MREVAIAMGFPGRLQRILLPGSPQLSLPRLQGRLRRKRDGKYSGYLLLHTFFKLYVLCMFFGICDTFH